MSRPHFVPADADFTCHECENGFRQDDLQMVYLEKYSRNGNVLSKRRVLCEDCGKLLIESLECGG